MLTLSENATTAPFINTYSANNDNTTYKYLRCQQTHQQHHIQILTVTTNTATALCTIAYSANKYSNGTPYKYSANNNSTMHKCSQCRQMQQQHHVQILTVRTSTATLNITNQYLQRQPRQVRRRLTKSHSTAVSRFGLRSSMARSKV